MKVNGSEKKVLYETRDMVIRMEEHIKSIDEKMSCLPCQKHDDRIKDNERWRWKAVGAIALIIFLINLFVDKVLG